VIILSEGSNKNTFVVFRSILYLNFSCVKDFELEVEDCISSVDYLLKFLHYRLFKVEKACNFKNISISH